MDKFNFMPLPTFYEYKDLGTNKIQYIPYDKIVYIEIKYDEKMVKIKSVNCYMINGYEIQITGNSMESFIAQYKDYMKD